MKIKTKIDGVYIEPWETPLISAENLWSKGVFHSNWATHFLFSINQESDIHALTIESRSPVRIFDENHQDFIQKYFKTTLSPDKQKHKIPNICRTWKLWGTQLIKEMDESYFLSNYAAEHDADLFQYLIFTQDEWFEFIAKPPTWEVFKNSDTKSIVSHFIETDHTKPWVKKNARSKT
jgi:hypothetical protein